ncbi:MAG: DUF2784 domain-containing protein [Bacteroidota bacterium]|nr:DUF2784 domain-containing protein [Bacteroidota bacterium]
MYRFLDLFFIIFHTLLIFFNLFGWIWKPLRKANLITLLLTGGSWFILGIFYGIGYCPLTDWHWDVLQKLGQTEMPSSYVSYLIHRLTGYLPGVRLTDTLTVVMYFLALAVSVFVNVRDITRRKRTSGFPE